jgi:hypothetical protein
MAEERTLGLARATEESTEELSKEQLQRRMDQARDSISHTVTEIKESVANQVQAVKDTLDWREQFKKRPVAWSVGAFGVGLLVGCGVAGLVKGEEENEPSRDYRDYYAPDYRSYAAQPVLSQAGATMTPQSLGGPQKGNGHEEDKGPGLIGRLTNTAAYGRMRDEVGSVGDSLIQELTKTAKAMVVPAIIGSLRKFLGEHLPESERREPSSRDLYAESKSDQRWSKGDSSYQPALERN